MMDAYSVIAKIYDYANTDFDYPKYFEFTKHYLTGEVVELACGSGAFTSYLVKVADSVIAVDNCKEMLDKAVENNFKNRKYIHFVQDDIKNFAPPSKVNAVIAVCDGFNYINKKHLSNVFAKISSYIKTGGHFIFDISSEYKLKNIIGNNVFFEDTDEFTYLWTNQLKSDCVQMDITMFEACGEVYKRADESHIQYFHNEDMLTSLLNNVGFEVSVFDGETFEECSETSSRLLFVCKKAV